MKPLKPEQIPQSVKSAVSAYLMARAMAETHREKVDAIARRILAEVPICTDPELTGRLKPEFDRITEPKYAYLMTDTDAEFYHAQLRHELEKSGYEIEPIESRPGHWKCPALCAEWLQRDTEQLLIEEAARMLNIENPTDFNHRILCQPSGLEKRKRFIDLVCKLVVNLPDFKNPLTGRKAA